MDRTNLITVAALSFGVLGVILSITAHRRISSARRSLTLLQGGHDGETLVEAVASYIAEVEKVRDDMNQLGRRQQDLFGRLRASARNLGVVRYDAFEEMGGRMSFSAALLDDEGNGVVITSINGRTEARTYAKSIEQGNSDHNLSPEEREAISEALGGARAKVRR
ncbi:MAG: DUF4446 family protein [Actinomycetota bacterium]